MGKRDDLIEKYAKDLQEKCGIKADMDLLKQITIACGPSIYNRDASTVSSGDPAEVDRVKQNFIQKRLGITDDAKQEEGFASAVEKYGKSNRTKYRAVLYYLLTAHFQKESVFKK